MVTERPIPAADRWHELLSTRYVCEVCLTRYFAPRRTCLACHRVGYIRPLVSMLLTLARDDEDLRTMIAHGQSILPGQGPEPDSQNIAPGPPAPEFNI